MLLVGTNDFAILTQPIDGWVDFRDLRDDPLANTMDVAALTFGEDDDEERKEEYYDEDDPRAVLARAQREFAAAMAHDAELSAAI